jgi:hypothetical protein
MKTTIVIAIVTSEFAAPLRNEWNPQEKTGTSDEHAGGNFL